MKNTVSDTILENFQNTAIREVVGDESKYPVFCKDLSRIGNALVEIYGDDGVLDTDAILTLSMLLLATMQLRPHEDMEEISKKVIRIISTDLEAGDE